MSYVFEERRAEHERLEAQAGLFEPLTERMPRRAGLEPGMRVLDVGSGAGHVAVLVSRLVGPEGSVLGVEQDPRAVEMAGETIRRSGATNVEIVVGNALTLEGIDDGFDAAVGRLVLMYLPDPVAALRQAAARVRPGGVVAFHEADLAYEWAVPETPLWERARGWFLDTIVKVGVEPRMGLRLYRTFLAAGLPAPDMMLETLVEGGREAPAYGWANLLIGIVPLMERLGVATTVEVQPDTLAERLLAETLAKDGVIVGPPMIGAWSRVAALASRS